VDQRAKRIQLLEVVMDVVDLHHATPHGPGWRDRKQVGLPCGVRARVEVHLVNLEASHTERGGDCLRIRAIQGPIERHFRAQRSASRSRVAAQRTYARASELVPHRNGAPQIRGTLGGSCLTA
jgi:hypothetical protein